MPTGNDASTKLMTRAEISIIGTMTPLFCFHDVVIYLKHGLFIKVWLLFSSNIVIV